MNAPLFSFIIPAYNAENNLEKCVDSLLKQSCSTFEVLLVNDGSLDGTAGICDRYSSTDPRIKVFHKQNAGVGAARNTGLDHVSGEYICFMDADDWIEPDFLEQFMKHIEPGEALVIFNHYVIGKRKIYKKHDHEDVVYRSRDFSGLFNSLNFLRNGYVWSKIYSAAIVKEQGIRFDEGIHFAEDLLFNLEYLRCVQTVKFLNYAGYHYLHNVTTSLSASYNSFPSEYRAFEKIKAQLLHIQASFPLDVAARSYVDVWLGRFFLRSIQSFYFSRISTPLDSRIAMLKQAHQPENIRYIRKVNPLKLQRKIRGAIFLFRNRNFMLYDAYMNLLTKVLKR